MDIHEGRCTRPRWACMCLLRTPLSASNSSRRGPYQAARRWRARRHFESENGLCEFEQGFATMRLSKCVTCGVEFKAGQRGRLRLHCVAHQPKKARRRENALRTSCTAVPLACVPVRRARLLRQTACGAVGRGCEVLALNYSTPRRYTNGTVSSAGSAVRSWLLASAYPIRKHRSLTTSCPLQTAAHIRRRT